MQHYNGVTRGVTRKAQFSGRRITMGATKSPNYATSTFFNTVYLLSKDLRFERGGRHLTSLRPWLSQNLSMLKARPPMMHLGNEFAVNVMSHTWDVRIAILYTGVWFDQFKWTQQKPNGVRYNSNTSWFDQIYSTASLKNWINAPG